RPLEPGPPPGPRIRSLRRTLRSSERSRNAPWVRPACTRPAGQMVSWPICTTTHWPGSSRPATLAGNRWSASRRAWPLLRSSTAIALGSSSPSVSQDRLRDSQTVVSASDTASGWRATPIWAGLPTAPLATQPIAMSVTTMAPIQKWATTKMSTAARRPTASTVMRTASITTWCFGIGLVVTARSQMLGGGLLHGGDDRVPLGAGLAGDGDEVVHAEDAGHARSLKYRFGKGI